MLTENDAIDRAWNFVARKDAGPLRAVFVHRIDGGSDYYLIIHKAEGTSSILAIDANSGQLLERAETKGNVDDVVLPAVEAIKRAGATMGSNARLVWRSSQASRSALWPFWEIVDGKTHHYVNFQGAHWVDTLPE